MDASEVLDGLVEDVEAELDSDSDEQTLELTIALVAGLLERGLLAGDSPAAGSAVRFNAWTNQQPSAVHAPGHA